MNLNLLKYHPVRYKFVLNNFIDKVYLKQQPDEEGKYTLLELGTKFMDELEDLIESTNYPMSWKLDEFCGKKEEIFSEYESFVFYGENIFHIQPLLVTMFRNTDASEVIYSTLKLPYEQVYLYFGDNKYFEIEKGVFIDGAYLKLENSNNESLAFIILTTRNTNLKYEKNNNELIFLDYEDHLYYLLKGDDKITVGDALLSCLNEEHFDFYDDKIFYKWKPHLLSVTNLIVNSLCYLNSVHCEINKRFPDETPQSLVNKFINAKSDKDKDRAISKASSQGFRRINFLGDSIQKEYQSKYSKKEIEISTHWRRGHWRNQAFGQDYEQHKLIWIMPTLVNKDNDDEFPKHIYNVE